ncbi:MAG: ComF family protein [Ekhidna sp.]|nr:ComF family protein [Ekhidna sp.]
MTDDLQNPNNDLFRKFSFEPKIKSASSYLYFINGGIAQKLLYSLKYSGKKEIGTMMGNWLASAFDKNLNVDFVVPVPLHKSKLRTRTYNQSEVIAKSFVSDLSSMELRTDLVKRTVATRTQTKKSKVQRWRNMQNVYSEVQHDLSGKSILIVDDVITTGATVGMLCERLIESGCSDLHILSVARGK